MLNHNLSNNCGSSASLPSKKSHNFPPEKRLHNSNEFGLVFKTGNHRFRQDMFQLIALTRTDESSRLGIVVPKKMLKRAVHRNRLKRLVREKFRKWEAKIACDVVIALKQKVNPEILYSEAMTETVHQLFEKLDQFSSRKPKGKKGSNLR